MGRNTLTGAPCSGLLLSDPASPQILPKGYPPMTQKAKKAAPRKRAAPRKKKAPHRPRKRISSEQVEELAKLLCTQEEMAAVLGVSRHTIIRRIQEGGAFATAYKKGHAEAKKSLRRAQYEAAISGNPTMLIWMGKQHLDQRDRQDIVTHGEVEEFSEAYIEAGKSLVESVAVGATKEEILKMFEAEVRAIVGKPAGASDRPPN